MREQSVIDTTETSPYPDNYSHLMEELEWLDLLIRRKINEFRLAESHRRATSSSLVYISHEEADSLLRPGSHERNQWAADSENRSQMRILKERLERNVEQSARHGVLLALPSLVRTFGLTPFEQQVLVICLAPEIERKYDRLYAYLQDDITRKRPSVDLILTLLTDTPAARLEGRALLSYNSRLFRSGILQNVDDPQSPSGSSDLGRFLRIDPRILN